MFAVTDGHDNSTRKYNQPQPNKMIGEKPNGWSFVYLCADMRAVRKATHMGIPVDKALMFYKIRRGSDAAWGSINNQTSNFRSQSGQEFAFDRDNRKPRIIPKQKNSSAFHQTRTHLPGSNTLIAHAKGSGSAMVRYLL